MVYRGKPSLGCELCRRRKIRCDQARPACSQCIKHGVTCPGYRDLAASNFLDETQAVTARALSRRDASSSSSTRRKRPTQGLISSRSHSQDLEVDLDLAVAARPGPFASSPPATSVEDKAINYFYNSFVTPGYILLLPDRRTLHSIDPILRNSLLCTAMASFANKIGSRADLVQARRRYARALTLTNECLRSYESARKDETLTAVLLLNVFENLDCDNVDRMTSWQNHVRGCSAMLRLRDPSKLLTPAGFEVFAQLRPLMLINCIWDLTPSPPHWAEYLRFSDKYHSARQRRVNRMIWLGIEVGDLRAKIRDGHITDSQAIYERCREIDHALAEWETSSKAHPQWHYDVIVNPDADPDFIWRGKYHAYSDFGFGLNWAILRSLRILLANMMSFRLGQFGDKVHLEDQLRIAATRSRLIDDICAGAPWKIGLSPASASGSPAGRRRPENLAMPAFPAYGEQLGIFFVGETIILITDEARDLCHFQELAARQAGEISQTDSTISQSGRQDRQEQLQWIIGRLEYIAKLGIRQGSLYASILRAKWDQDTSSMNPKPLLWQCFRNQEDKTFRERINNLLPSGKTARRPRFFSPDFP